MHVLQNLILAHGALGSLDEIIPIALIGGLAVIFIVVGFMARKSEAVPDKSEQATEDNRADAATAQDHYRLD
jgi:hypothetical protein